jgi:hypothetical protein
MRRARVRARPSRVPPELLAFHTNDEPLRAKTETRMPTGEETQFTMTITRRIDGSDYVAGKQFASSSRGVPSRESRAMGEIALALMDRIDQADIHRAKPTKHS